MTQLNEPITRIVPSITTGKIAGAFLLSKNKQENPQSAKVEIGDSSYGDIQSEEELNLALEDINKKMKDSDASVEFTLDKSTGLSCIKLVNTQTGEVIRQIPSEEVLAMSRRLRQLSNRDISGIMIDRDS